MRRKEIIVIKKMLILLITLLLVIFFNGILNDENIVFTDLEIFYYSSLVYIFILVTWFLIFKSLINSYIIFIGSTYIFYFGQYVSIVSRGDIKIPLNIKNTYSEYLYSKLSIYVIICILLIYLGTIFTSIFYKKIKFRKKRKSNLSVQSMRIVSVCMLVLTYIPALITLIIYIKITLTQGYAEIFKSDYYNSGGLNNILKFLSTFAIPSLILSLVSFKNTKKMKIIVGLSLLYILLYFLSGSRFGAFIFLITIILLKKYYIGGLNKKLILKISILSILFLFLLSFISTFRGKVGSTSNVNQALLESLIEIFKSNILFKFLEEFGFTMVANATVFNYTPETISYGYGETYIAGLMQVFPNLFWDVHPFANINIDLIFNKLLSQYGGMGSSFIAESYYNFGINSLFLMPIFGMLLFKLFIGLERAAEQNNLIKGYIYLNIFNFTLFYIRTDIISFWRSLVYEVFFIYLFVYIVDGILNLLKKLKRGKI